MNKLIVFCPNPFSNYSIATIELLARYGLGVNTVICRRLINPRRFIHEYQQSRGKLLRKIYRKLILRSSENRSVNTTNSIKSFMQAEQIKARSIYGLQKRYGFKVLSVADYCSAHVIQEFDRVKPVCSIFTGGGIIPESIIAKSGQGVLNCHMGILPYYRGVDVVEWPLLDGRFDQVGMTVHLMEKTIDTGPIVAKSCIDVSKFTSIGDLRNYIESMMPQFMVQSCAKLLAGEIRPQPQSIGDGCLHFAVHKQLRPLVDKYLRDGPNCRVSQPHY